MVQKSQTTTVWMGLRPVVNKGVFTISAGEFTGFQNHPTVSTAAHRQVFPAPQSQIHLRNPQRFCGPFHFPRRPDVANKKEEVARLVVGRSCMSPCGNVHTHTHIYIQI